MKLILVIPSQQCTGWSYVQYPVPKMGKVVKVLNGVGLCQIETSVRDRSLFAIDNESSSEMKGKNPMAQSHKRK